MSLRPLLSHEMILAWADAHHCRTGKWPKRTSGPVAESPGESWQAIDAALAVGARGLPGGMTLPQLLQAERGVRNIRRLPSLQPRRILEWADAYRERTGSWQKALSGPIPDSGGESWRRAESALIVGTRGLPGGDSLAQFLTRHRGMRNRARLCGSHKNSF